MLRVIETFSGIGSQAKALKNIGEEYEILATVEWDINAIYAYDIIHHGPQDLTEYEKMNKEELIELLGKHTLSSDGKKAISLDGLKHNSRDVLQRVACAMKRSKNLASITEIRGEDLSNDVDLLTYSFPCQDLSVCGFWRGNTSGIDRTVKNRSGMLWEVERILMERVEAKLPLPKFLLMENVSNILSPAHRKNFNEWRVYLEELGYENQVYKLNATDFGIPQKRVRVYMLSVLCNDYNRMDVRNYFLHNNLEQVKRELKPLGDFLRLNYDDKEDYRKEANISQPNNTPSRQKIYENNIILWKENKICVDAVNTITTKQDRHPNSGLIEYDSNREGKAAYRNLTPRECFLLMGFDEEDYSRLIENDFPINKTKMFLTREKLIKMAGNSIVVDVLEAIFRQIIEIKDNILDIKST